MFPSTAWQNHECRLHPSLLCFLLGQNRTAFSNLSHKAPLFLVTVFQECCGCQGTPGGCQLWTQSSSVRSTVRPERCQAHSSGLHPKGALTGLGVPICLWGKFTPLCLGWLSSITTAVTSPSYYYYIECYHISEEYVCKLVTPIGTQQKSEEFR